MKRFFILFTAAVFISSLTTACETRNNHSDKTTITIASYSKHNFQQLETLVETRYDDIDLQHEYILRDSYTSNIERRLRKNMASDLIILDQLSDHYMQQYMADLSGYSFCAKYEHAIMDNLRINGNTYVIPITGYYQGYLYNKTIFEQYQIPIPKNNADLEHAIKQLTAKGIDNGYGSAFGIQVDGMSSLGIYVLSYAVPDFLSTVDGIRWSGKFFNHETAFSGTWEPIFDRMLALIDKDIINPQSVDRQRRKTDICQDMARGRLAVAFSPALSLDVLIEENRIATQNGASPSIYKYEMLPFLSSENRHSWTTTIPDCYIGINGNLKQRANAKKLNACERILSLISTQEGQRAITNDMEGNITYLKDSDILKDCIPDGLEETVSSGYVYTFKLTGKTLEAIDLAFGKGLKGFLTAAQCTAAIDQYYYEGDEEDEYSFSVAGNLLENALVQDFNVRKQETEIGNLLTDSILELTGAQIAVANGGGIRESLYKGDVIGDDLLSACPFDNKIVVLSMTGKKFCDMLENGLSQIQTETGIPGGRFLQIAGAHYTFDSAEPIGSRLVSVSLADGTPLDPKKIYTVAVNDYMAGAKGYDSQGNGDGYTMINVYSDMIKKASGVTIIKETDKTYRDAIVSYFSLHSDKPVTAALEGRITNVESQ